MKRFYFIIVFTLFSLLSFSQGNLDQDFKKEFKVDHIFFKGEKKTVGLFLVGAGIATSTYYQIDNSNNVFRNLSYALTGVGGGLLLTDFIINKLNNKNNSVKYIFASSYNITNNTFNLSFRCEF